MSKLTGLYAPAGTARHSRRGQHTLPRPAGLWTLSNAGVRAGSGVDVGDPVVRADKLQKVINNLQTAQTREAASLKGAIETNQAARTTTGFRQSTAGYYPQAQVWMAYPCPPWGSVGGCRV